MRVLHGPTNVGNQPWVLSRNERALGAHSDLVVTSENHLGYSADRVLASARSGSPGRGAFVPRALGFARRFAFGLTCPFRYDVFHYYFGRSFWETGRRLPGRFVDLKIARRLGRKVFMTLQGCDLRNSSRSASDAVSMCREGNCRLVSMCRSTEDAKRRQLAAAILPLCDRVFVLNPDLLDDCADACFLPYASVDIDAIEPCPPRPVREGEPIRLLHAPSDPAIKGTRHLLAAVERLRTRWPIELILVQGMPHAQALQRYREADLVVDQLLAGWYGGFAVETMALGKPVACFLRERDLARVPAGMREELPILRVHPDSLEGDLEALFRRREEWSEWGRRSRRFVERWHHPRRIAAAMLRAYRDPGARFVLDVDEPTATAVAA